MPYSGMSDSARAHPSLLLGAAAALGVVGMAGAALAPSLLAHSPLLLVALSPIPRHLVLAATATPIVPFVVIGTVRRMLASVLGYYIGRAYGPDGIAFMHGRYPRFSPMIRVIERWFDRAAPLLLLISPGPILCALAGATGLRLWLVVPIATLGQAIWIAATYKVGDALSEWLVPIVDFIRAHVVSTTLACVVIVIGYRLLTRSGRRRRRLAELAELDAEAARRESPAGSER